MKILIVYYSYEGNTRFVAEHIAEFFHADVQELRPKIDMHSRSFMKYVWGGNMVLMREKPDLNRSNSARPITMYFHRHPGLGVDLCPGNKQFPLREPHAGQAYRPVLLSWRRAARVADR